MNDWKKEKLGEIFAGKNTDIETLLEELSRLRKITQWAEPSTKAMEEALGDKTETFAYGCTIRRCLDCNTPVYGGPTRCSYCVGKIVGREKAEATIAAMRSALQIIVDTFPNLFIDLADAAGEILYEANKALSNTAGSEYAERVKKLEAAAWAVVNARGSRINFNAAFNMQPIEIQNKINELEYQISAAIDNLQAVLGEGKADGR